MDESEKEPTAKPQPDESAPVNREAEIVEDEQSAAPPNEPKKEFFEELVRQQSEHLQDLESSVIEPCALSETVTKFETASQEFFRVYLETKRQKGLFGEQPVEQLAQELAEIEQKMISPLAEMLKKPDFEISADQAANCLIGAREAFYSMILNDRLSAAKILEVLDGGIKIQKNPGEEVHDRHKHLEKIVAYLGFDRDNEQFRAYFYEDLFKEEKKDIAFLVRHEFMHAAAFSIWGERYGDFKEAAKNPGAHIDEYNDLPELQAVLRMVDNPTNAKPFFRGYIRRILEAIEEAQSEEDKAFYRQTAANEIVADLGTHFLEGAKTPEGFLDLRARYIGNSPKELLDSICQLEGVENKQHLFKNYKIDLAADTPEQIFKKLSSSEKLEVFFTTTAVWHERLTQLFENRGQNLKRPEFTDEEIDELGDVELDVPLAPAHPGRFETSTGAPSKSNDAVSTFISFWNMVTGKQG